jgi:uncharacterized protein
VTFFLFPINRSELSVLSVTVAAVIANALPGTGSLAAAGLLIGCVIGLTGMGGGALMTPILVLVFGVNPAAAVSSDVVVSLIIKPFGAAVHRKAGTVHWGIVQWLTVGSVPGAVLGTILGHRFLSHHDKWLRGAIGVTLLIAGALMAKRLVANLRSRRSGDRVTATTPGALDSLTIRPVQTVLIGLLGGLFVGATSVGSGSLILALLVGLYPKLKTSQLVGTDLAQAIPLVGAAAIAHLFFGKVDTGLVGPLVLGAIPGVLIGGIVSSHVADTWIRPAIVTVLIGSGLKLINVF